MATRLEIFVDELDAEWVRRRRELSDIRLMAASATGRRATAIRRAGHIIAYAQWEGFGKFVIAGYLQYLCDRGDKIADLKANLRATALSRAVRSTSPDDDGFSVTLALIDALDTASNEKFTVEPKKLVYTGNLDSRKLRHLLQICALEYLDFYATREQFIDGVLCGRRHRLAHGSMEPVDHDDLQQALDGVIALCQQLNDQVVESLLYTNYIRPEVIEPSARNGPSH
jgi:MAE_28990/MAE_18760-like HEPN